MKVIYRRINFHDGEELKFLASTDVEIPALFDADFSTDDESVQKMLKALEKFTDEDFCQIAVNERGQIVGYHIIKKVPYFNRFAGSIYTLWVSPDWRNKGYATELKRQGEAWAKDCGLDHIYTWVHADNSKMVKLNKAMGYQTVNYKMKKKI